MKLYLKIIIGLTLAGSLAGGFYAWHTERQASLQQQTSGATDLNDYYHIARSLGKKVELNTEVKFLAVGDIMLSRGVALQMTKAGKDGFFPFRTLDNLLSSTNFNFGNLEYPFSGTDEQSPDPKTFTFNAPTWAMKGLSQYNFKILNLANNHILNQGSEGLSFTKQYLQKNYLTGVGAGQNLDEAWDGKVINSKGINIGFIGATYAPNSGYVAHINNLERLKISIADLKQRSDFVVVSMHAGEEYIREPNSSQSKFARAAIDYGADLVIGAHPHWIQPVELYNGKYIFYSLGNFVFDQTWSEETKQGLTLEITLAKAGNCTSTPGLAAACGNEVQGTKTAATLKQIRLIPVIIESTTAPRLATDLEKQTILNKIGLSNDLLVP